MEKLQRKSWVWRGLNSISYTLNCTLWVWGRALALRESSITNTQLKRRRPTPGDPTKLNKRKKWISPKQLRPDITISLTTTDPCLPSLGWQWSNVCYSISSHLVRRNLTYNLSLCRAVWVCFKQGFENKVLVVLLQIWVKDLTVYTAQNPNYDVLHSSSHTKQLIPNQATLNCFLTILPRFL